MNLLSSLAPWTIAVTAILTFYAALVHLTRRKIHGSHVIRIVRDLILGTPALQRNFLSREMMLEHPFPLYPFITFLFLTGPQNYMRDFMFLYPGRPIPAHVTVQLIPADSMFYSRRQP